jgi:hypothetical protein
MIPPLRISDWGMKFKNVQVNFDLNGDLNFDAFNLAGRSPLWLSVAVGILVWGSL